MATTSADTVYESLKSRLSRVMPDFEIRLKADVAAEILDLKRERNAVILAHNYMEPALFYSVPDYRGDSLELSRVAASVDAEVIVFCGVRFMAETAKILSPERTVLLPASGPAGCSLAASITAEDVRELRRRFPGVPVVAYVNTYADVKAEVDICCTSGNARAVVESLDADTVIFLPDEFLARNVARETGRNILVARPGGEVEAIPGGDGNGMLVGWNGRCEVHELFTAEDVATARAQFPDVVVLAHPECPPEVVDAADFSASTSAMTRFVEESDAPHFLLLTECSMGDNIAAANPDKDMLRLCSHRCPHMAEITLEDVRNALLHDRQLIELPEDVRRRAHRSLQRMIAIS
ncbi:MAG: quinolinate synthase NadA [Gammaproteobacteria bacterium]